MRILSSSRCRRYAQTPLLFRWCVATPPTATAAKKDEEAPGQDVDGTMDYYNPWEVLGLQPHCSAHAVRLRYHELLQECHPDYCKAGGEGDITRLNEVNKAYEIITKSPTLDRRYRNLVNDKQRLYYKFLPEWMAKNVDDMPRYVSYARWKYAPSAQMVILASACFMLGKLYMTFPFFTLLFFAAVMVDVLFHTMFAPSAGAILAIMAVINRQSYSMSWLQSPKNFLQRNLGY